MRALDAADAARAFAAGWSAPLQERDTQALVALYRFDSGRGTQVADASGHAASLVIPGELRIGERRLLAWRDRGRGLDRLVNTVAFVPFGFAIERTLAGRRRARARLAIGLCITFSLAVGVEIAQYFLAARTSSWIDAILNALGAGIGIGIARGVRAPCLQLRV